MTVSTCPSCHESVTVPVDAQPESIVRCPLCQEEALRIFTPPHVVYKGTGWSGAGHGIPDMDEREKLPGPLEFGDLLEE